MTRVVVIGNCQAAGIAAILKTSPDLESVEPIGVHPAGIAYAESRKKELIRGAQSGELTIISFRLSDNFGWLSTNSFSAISKRYYTITNSYFAGLHPDITYVGAMGKRIQGPLGDYNSKLILYGFLSGMSREECAALFCHDVYELLGFYDELDLSIAELKKRGEGTDIDLSSYIENHIRSVPLFSVVNHPTRPVFIELANASCECLGVSAPPFPAEYYENPLHDSIWWPVYQELREKHGVSYSTPMLFRQAKAHGGASIGLDQVIDGFFTAYSKLDKAVLASTSAGQHVMSLGQERLRLYIA